MNVVYYNNIPIRQVDQDFEVLMTLVQESWRLRDTRLEG